MIVSEEIIYMKYVIVMDQTKSLRYCRPHSCAAVLGALKVIYHPLYGMNNYVLIWGD